MFSQTGSPGPPTYATVMVAFDLGVGAGKRVELAASLADRFSSRLIGVAAEQVSFPVHGDNALALDARLVEAEEARVAENLARAEGAFWREAGARGGVEWRSGTAAPLTFIAEQARAADLVVVGQQGADEPEPWGMSANPGDLVLDLGRPMLLVPPRIASLRARRIVVAWKNTREARRAVWDSLPFLGQAEEVVVVTVGLGADREGAADVVEHLRRHGIASRALARPEPELSTAHEIHGIARHEGADLIVCGAYGHSRIRELIFGGVTRNLLDTSPVCCLMSH